MPTEPNRSLIGEEPMSAIPVHPRVAARSLRSESTRSRAIPSRVKTRSFY